MSTICDPAAVTAGQTWSLLTTNEKGIATLKELRPGGEDGRYVVGFTWPRQRAFRVTKNFNDRVWAAFAVETPETTYSAAFVPANIIGLNTSENSTTGVNLLPLLPSAGGERQAGRVARGAFSGRGIGRYGSSGMPDATLDPATGELRPLHEARIMGGVVYHRSSRLDLYAYGGDE